ncbi:MAG: peptidylprolyl isomerase [Clostridia bacterium]|nr:peptidylprolyl isomerase [Clostridia bacterium]
MNIVKNRKFKRILALVLATVMLVLTLGSCGSSSEVVISFGGVEITSNMYLYWMSRYKAMFLYMYLGAQTDYPAFWEMEMAEGVTAGTYLGAVAAQNIISNAICVKLYDDYGLKLSNDEIKTVETQIDSLISAAGSKSALNSALSAYGVNVDMLKEIYLMEAKISGLQEYLYGDNGIDAPTDEELDTYYEENYYRVKHLLIRTDVRIEKDENGEAIVDESTGSYKTVELTDEEIEQQQALAADLKVQIAAGANFDTLCYDYSEDTAMQYFTDGYYITGSSTFLPTEIVTAVPNMAIGEVKTFETDYGIHYVKRYELIDKAYNVEPYATSMFTNYASTVASLKMQEMIAQYADLVVLNEELIAAYPLANCTPNFSY